MPTPQIVPPSSETVSQVSSIPIAKRELVERKPLSVIERVHLEGDHARTAILKTTIPELQAEVYVHRFVSPMDVCAASLIASDPDAEWPWLLMKDLGTGSTNQPPVEGATWEKRVSRGIEMLAQFHAASLESVDSYKLLDGSPRGMLTREHEIAPLITNVLERAMTPDPSHVTELFFNTLRSLDTKLSGIPVTMVHGDYDRGNVVLVDEAYRAVDWGLAHRNMALVDLAHMIYRYRRDYRSDFMGAYFEAARTAGLNLGHKKWPGEEVTLAFHAHHAFFGWWRSYCVANLGFEDEQFIKTTADRIKLIIV